MVHKWCQDQTIMTPFIASIRLWMIVTMQLVVIAIHINQWLFQRNVNHWFSILWAVHVSTVAQFGVGNAVKNWTTIWEYHLNLSEKNWDFLPTTGSIIQVREGIKNLQIPMLGSWTFIYQLMFMRTGFAPSNIPPMMGPNRGSFQHSVLFYKHERCLLCKCIDTFNIIIILCLARTEAYMYEHVWTCTDSPQQMQTNTINAFYIY